MSTCSLKHTDCRTLAALLSLVSSFHQFTLPLAALSGAYTGGDKKTSARTFNHPTRRSSQQMQGQGWSKTGKLIFNFDQTRACARRYIYLLPLQEFLLRVGQYDRDSQRNGSIHRALLQPFLFLKTEELIALILLRISSSICSSAVTAGWQVNQKKILY